MAAAVQKGAQHETSGITIAECDLLLCEQHMGHMWTCLRRERIQANRADECPICCGQSGEKSVKLFPGGVLESGPYLIM